VTRAKTGKLYRTFNKGLITEAGFLTYPEDASTDELNTVLTKKGNRTRRLGLDYEVDSTDIEFPNVDDGDVTTEFFWRAPGNASGLNYLTVQVGRYVYFFDVSVAPLSEGKKSYVLDLNDFAAPNATVVDLSTTNVSFAGGKGYLFIVQEFIDPITVEYKEDTDTFESVKVRILMRDFDGVYDGLANDDEPTSLSNTHHYNLRNQGWVPPGSRSAGGGGGSVGGTGGSSTGSAEGSFPDGPAIGGGTYDPYEGGIYPRTVPDEIPGS
jgi:hypothetical protein